MRNFIILSISILSVNLAIAQGETQTIDRLGIHTTIMSEQPSLGFNYKVTNIFSISPYYSENRLSNTKVNAAYSNRSEVINTVAFGSNFVFKFHQVENISFYLGANGEYAKFKNRRFVQDPDPSKSRIYRSDLASVGVFF